MKANCLRLLFLLSLVAGQVHLTLASEKVLLGVDVLKRDGFALLQGKRVGLITNSTGYDSKGKRTIDLLYKAPGVKLVALFSPEHGLKGTMEHGAAVGDARDKKTGLPVYSLYGKSQRPTEEMLREIDALVFDIQDVGTRFYTYVTTLAYALEEAARKRIEFVVLDRPNPITGEIVEGEVLSPEIRHFTAYLALPVRHGMTVGEIAEWYNKTAALGAPLTVVKMEGWRRGMWWDETRLKFRPPSPNIRNLKAAALYPGIGGLEATNVSVGRGTAHPFEWVGAPWIDAETLLEKLNFYYLSGFEFKAVQFTPKKDIYKGQLCRGVEIKITDRGAARPVDLFITLMTILKETYPEEFQVRWEELARVSGSRLLEEKLKFGQTPTEMIFLVQEKAKAFEGARKPYLLYK